LAQSDLSFRRVVSGSAISICAPPGELAAIPLVGVHNPLAKFHAEADPFRFCREE
jgi:hypothetical protein